MKSMGKIECYNNDKIVCVITYSTPHNPVYVENISSFFLDHPFGPRTEVNWDELEKFLESRCFPKERPNCKELLYLLDVDSYDPWQIIKKTEGRMCEDHMWLKIIEE